MSCIDLLAIQRVVNFFMGNWEEPGSLVHKDGRTYSFPTNVFTLCHEEMLFCTFLRFVSRSKETNEDNTTNNCHSSSLACWIFYDLLGTILQESVMIYQIFLLLVMNVVDQITNLVVDVFLRFRKQVCISVGCVPPACWPHRGGGSAPNRGCLPTEGRPFPQKADPPPCKGRDAWWERQAPI